MSKSSLELKLFILAHDMIGHATVTAVHGIILTRHGMLLTHDHSIQALSVEQASTIEGLELRNTNLDLDKDRLTAELKTAHGQIDGLEVRDYVNLGLLSLSASLLMRFHGGWTG
jgi:hypothetical protein